MGKNHGDSKSFKENWRKRPDGKRNWFCKERPKNQIEFAFMNHFSFLKEVIGIPPPGHCLEVGAGRGSFAEFFAEAGYEVTLFDVVPEIVKDAEDIFKKNKHAQRAHFVVGDAEHMEFADGTFDIITSIGLLEHFFDPSVTIAEQVRVLKKGGVFTAYVVPKKRSVQDVFKSVNDLMKKMAPLLNLAVAKTKKKPLFRTQYGLEFYLPMLRRLKLKDIGSSGVYPYPAISFSPEFPFSLMPSDFEKALVKVFQGLEQLRRETDKGKHPWACDESIAQGFFIWGTKP